MEDAMDFTVVFDGREKDMFRTYFGSLGITHKFNAQSSIQWLSSAYSTKEQETYDIRGEYWLNQATAQEQLGVGTYLEHARNMLNSNTQTIKLNYEGRLKNHSLLAGFSSSAITACPAS